MKQVHANYTFVASTKTITLTGLNIAQDQLLLITNATRGVIYYNFASSSHRAVVTAGADTTVVLTDASTTGHADSDQLTIYYDDQVSGSSVSVSNFPATQTIAGTVTANNQHLSSNSDAGGFPVVRAGIYAYDYNSNIQVGISVLDPESGSPALNIGGTVTIGSLPAISGTVTVGNSVTVAGTVTANVLNSVTIGAIIGPTGGTCLKGISPSGDAVRSILLARDSGGTYGEIQGSDANVFNLPVYGTVTVSQLPRVTFIDGSGTVTTANSAITVFASSTTRSYLLVQVTTGSAFVNVGATATTVNGISLTAGQGYAWETTIPQGIVSLISTTTSSRYVAKQA